MKLTSGPTAPPRKETPPGGGTISVPCDAGALPDLVVDAAGAARALGISRATFDRLSLLPGFPKLDLTPPGARRRHVFRYCIPDVISWARERGKLTGTGNGGSDGR